jgi:hypothetical protein
MANFLKTHPFHKNRAVNLHNIMKNRAERLICFLVVWLTMISSVLGQTQKMAPAVVKKDFSHLPLPGMVTRQTTGKTDVKEQEPAWGELLESASHTGGLYHIPSNIFYTQSGVFCKMEWELEKASHIPFRFRLGSLADCNALEGKH